jgi:hypothetical protein
MRRGGRCRRVIRPGNFCRGRGRLIPEEAGRNCRARCPGFDPPLQEGGAGGPADPRQPMVSGAVARTVPHSIRDVPPSAVSSIEIVNRSTGSGAADFVIGTLPISRSGT